jgi:DNA-binding transcriptional regulator/RsmH inhibitor MraZ
MVKLRAQIATMPTPEQTALKRHIGSNSARVTMDSAKRLGIPAEMADIVGIKDEAVFAGMLDYFEIWPPERYAAMTASQKSDVTRAFQLLV